MKYLLFILFACCISCNQANEKKETQEETPAAAPVKKTVPEDSLTQKLRTVITAIETQELQQTNIIRSMSIDSIQHEMISLKDFYTIKKDELAKEVKFSTNKEKTNKALAYLGKMVVQSSVKPVVYKIQFHLNALLGNNTLYNEQHTKYLKSDLSEIKLFFPG